MFQPIILFTLLLSLTFLQPVADYPKLDNLQPLTVKNIASIEPLAALGSDTPDKVVWSPDGQTLAVVSSGHVFLYHMNDLAEPYLTITRQFDERVTFAEDGQLNVGNSIWDIEKGTSETVVVDTALHSPSGHVAVTSTTDAAQMLVVTITTDRNGKTVQLETGIPSTLANAVFSPDERFVVLEIAAEPHPVECCSRETAQLWNVDTGERVAVLDQTNEKISLIKFHADGQLLVTTSYSDSPYSSSYDEVRIWDVSSGEQLNADDPSSVSPVVFSTDKRLMVFLIGGGLSVWSDHNIGTLNYHTADTQAERYGYITNLLFSADGKSFMATDGDRVIIWDVDAIERLGEPRLIIENGYRDSISSYVLSAKSDLLVVKTFNGSLRIWDISQPEPVLLQVLREFTEPRISPDSQWLWVVASEGQQKALVDASTGEVLRQLPPNAQIDPDWKYAAYWAQSKIMVMSLTENTQQSLDSLPDYAGDALYYDIGNGQAAFMLGNTLKAYDLQTGNPTLAYEDHYNKQYRLTDDGKWLWAVDHDSYDGRVTSNMSIHETARPEAALFSLNIEHNTPLFLLLPDQQQLASIVPDGGVFRSGLGHVDYSRLNLWSVANGEQVSTWRITGGVQMAALNSTHQLLAMGSTYGTYPAAVQFVDLANPASTPRSFELNIYESAYIQMLKFSPNDQYFSAAVLDAGLAYSYSVFVWDTQTLTASREGTTPEPFLISGVQSPTFSPDNQFILCHAPRDYYSGPFTPQFQLWSLEDQVELGSINGDGIAAFSPDSHLLAIHDQNQTHILSVQALAKGDATPLVTIPDNEGQVKSIAFGPDGTLLYLVEQSRVRIYGIP